LGKIRNAAFSPANRINDSPPETPACTLILETAVRGGAGIGKRGKAAGVED
jgi:hypothetical protein